MPMTRKEGKWAFTHSNWVCTVTEIFDTALNNFWSRLLLLPPGYSLQTRPFNVTMTFKTSSSKVNLTLFSVSNRILQTFQKNNYDYIADTSTYGQTSLSVPNVACYDTDNTGLSQLQQIKQDKYIILPCWSAPQVQWSMVSLLSCS